MAVIIIQIICLFIALPAAVIAAIDIIPMLKNWLGRIHIGRYEDRQNWAGAIASTALAWLNRTPVIQATDNTRLIALDMLRGNYKKAAIQHWQKGALLLGAAERLKESEDKKAAEEIETFVRRHFDGTGGWRTKPEVVDAALLAYAVMKLPSFDPGAYKSAMDEVWKLIQNHIGKDGTVMYRRHMGSYRYVDTIGFICPFLIRYGLTYGEEQCVELAVGQIQAYADYGMLPDRSIPCHAYHIENKVPLGLYGWGRGLAWYAIGLIDAWNELPAEHRHKSVLEQYVKRFAGAVLSTQHQSGGWSWVVTRPETRLDASATAALGWFLANAARLPELEKDCREGLRRAIGFLMSVTRRNGAIDFSQGDTKDIGVYSMHFGVMPFTQGFCVRTMSSNVTRGM